MDGKRKANIKDVVSPPHPKQQNVDGKMKADTKDAASPPHPKQTKVDGKIKADIKTADKELPPTTKEMGSSSADLVCLSSAQHVYTCFLPKSCPFPFVWARLTSPVRVHFS